jgi:hypothetical protein
MTPHPKPPGPHTAIARIGYRKQFGYAVGGYASAHVRALTPNYRESLEYIAVGVSMLRSAEQENHHNPRENLACRAPK